MLVGLPGNGKSLTATKRILEALADGKRVVTNVPLDVERCEAYIEKRHGFAAATRVRELLVLVEQGEMREVFRVRGPGCGIPEGQNWKGDQRRLDRSVQFNDRGVRPWNMSAADCEQAVVAGEAVWVTTPAVEYYLDEVQNIWPARGWQDLSPGVPFWLSQHRHLGDNVCLITQREMQVDRLVRGLVQDYYNLINFSGRRRLGIRLPNLFGWARFEEPPGSMGAKPVEYGQFRLDVDGVAGCYSTVGGMGIDPATGKADTVRRHKGVPWPVFAVVIIGAIVFLGYAPQMVGKALAHVLMGGQRAAFEAMKQTNSPLPVSAAAVVKAEPEVSREIVRPPDKEPTAYELEVRRAKRPRLTAAMPVNGRWRMVVQRERESYVLVEGEPDVGKIEHAEDGSVWAVEWQGERVTWR